MPPGKDRLSNQNTHIKFPKSLVLLQKYIAMVLLVLKIFSLSLFIKNSNLVYTNKPFVSNLFCYCEFTKYLFYNNHFGSDNISALP
jgi:hypothetical protein